MANKKRPMRRCVGCGEMKEKKELLRVVRTEDGKIVLDDSGKKNGRGAYLCRDRKCLALARKNKGLERSFKQAISDEVYDGLDEEMEIFETQ